VDARAVADDEGVPAVPDAVNDGPVRPLERDREARSDPPVERVRLRGGRCEQREDGEYGEDRERPGHRSYRDTDALHGRISGSTATRNHPGRKGGGNAINEGQLITGGFGRKRGQQDERQELDRRDGRHPQPVDRDVLD
jgi:hypothetical protein